VRGVVLQSISRRDQSERERTVVEPDKRELTDPQDRATRVHESNLIMVVLVLSKAL